MATPRTATPRPYMNAILMAFALAGGGQLVAQEEALPGPADEDRTFEEPDLNYKQQARMKLSSANRSVSLGEKYDAKAVAASEPKKQEELRAKAKKSYESAIADYREALSLDGKLVEAYVGLAELMIKAGKIEQSIQTLEVALNVDPKSLKALAAKGHAQLAGFKVEDAKATYERIAAESGRAAKGYLTDMRAWLDVQRAKLGPEMKQAVEDLDHWIHEREGK